MFKELKDNVKREKGEAVSYARRLKPLAEVAKVESPNGAPAPTGIAVRMLDGNPMVYFNDGSLRHATGHKPGKAARKARKKARRKS